MCLGEGGGWGEVSLTVSSKSGTTFIDFKCSSDEDCFAFMLKPELEAKFPTCPMPLHSFLAFLEKQRVINVKIVNHSDIARLSSGQEGKDRVSFQVHQLIDTKWQPMLKDDDWAFWAAKLDCAEVQACPHLRVLLKLECPMSQSLRYCCRVAFAVTCTLNLALLGHIARHSKLEVLGTDKPACA